MRLPLRPSPLMSLAACVIAASGFVLPLGGCDALPGVGDDTGDDTAPLTQCIYSYGVEVAVKDIGESCAADSECAFGECMMPGDQGNITNSTFGFCTRGCDCDNAESAKIAEADKDVLECLYPPGNQGEDHHVVIDCDSVADCTDIDPGWTECSTSSGTAQSVCKAL